MDNRLHFDRRNGPAASAAGDGLEGLYTAVLQSSPSGSQVNVSVPNLWGLTAVRTAFCSSTFEGSVGDNVLVAFDEQKDPWVIATRA